jgi:hypothetical protein
MECVGPSSENVRLVRFGKMKIDLPTTVMDLPEGRFYISRYFAMVCLKSSCAVGGV